MSGALCKFNAKPRAGASGQHASYLTRESATGGNEEGIYLHNLGELKGADYRDTRTNIVSYAEARQDEELARPTRGGGQARTHYRCILSWDRKEDTEHALKQVKDYLKENFPNARAVAAIHQDTGHTHAHIWIDARQTDGKKLHLSHKDYRTLDDRWAKNYARHYGQQYEHDHLAKKKETREHKKARAQGIEKPKPQRARRATTTKEHSERERQNYGVHQARPRGNKRPATSRNQQAPNAGRGATGNGKHDASRGEREINRFSNQVERATEAARGALQQVERLREFLRDRVIGRDR
jgi:hypothetical protein